MPIKVGSAPVSWGIMEVQGWGDQTPFGKVLDEIAAAGYEGTELGPFGYLPTEPGRLKRELSARGLQLISAFVPMPLAEPERHETALHEAVKVADLLAESGAKLIVLADTMSPARTAVAGRVDERRDGLTDRQWEGAAKILQRAAAACKQRALEVSFHHHAGTYVETPEEVERLFSLTDPKLVGLCLDTGHYFYGGGDPVDIVRKYRSRISHLHFKDIRPAVLEVVKREGLGFLEAVRRGVFSELGEGAVNLPGVIQELQACGYDGWAVVEQDVDSSQPNVRPLESAHRSRQYLRKVIGI
jgi:inosose dehydratase